MLAFLLFTALLIAIYGTLHKIWNKRRDKRDALEPSTFDQ
jgi:MFS transporter, ACS family, allantoate permease